jgi:hypothetical protein
MEKNGRLVLATLVAEFNQVRLQEPFFAFL